MCSLNCTCDQQSMTRSLLRQSGSPGCQQQRTSTCQVCAAAQSNQRALKLLHPCSVTCSAARRCLLLLSLAQTPPPPAEVLFCRTHCNAALSRCLLGPSTSLFQSFLITEMTAPGATILTGSAAACRLAPLWPDWRPQPFQLLTEFGTLPCAGCRGGDMSWATFIAEFQYEQ